MITENTLLDYTNLFSANHYPKKRRDINTLQTAIAKVFFDVSR